MVEWKLKTLLDLEEGRLDRRGDIFHCGGRLVAVQEHWMCSCSRGCAVLRVFGRWLHRDFCFELNMCS